MSWNSYLKETFTLLAFNNFLAFETTGLIDFSLLIGNQLITFIAGLLAVQNLWYRAARTQIFIFLVISVYAFVSSFELFLQVLCLLELCSISFRTLTLANRISVNIFAGLLVIHAFCIFFFFDVIGSVIFLTFLVQFSLYELFNFSLQLYIFSLLMMDYNSGLNFVSMSIMSFSVNCLIFLATLLPAINLCYIAYSQHQIYLLLNFSSVSILLFILFLVPNSINIAAFFLAVIYAAANGTLFLFVILLFSNQLLWVQWFFLPKISMVLNLVFLFEFERFALNEPFYLPVTEGLQLLSFLVANEIPLLSTILYYELNGIELVLGFTLLTTLLNVLLILGSS